MRLTACTISMSLAKVAAHEHDVRKRRFPRLLEEGRITIEEAAGELEAWRVLAELFGTGSADTMTTWAELHMFVSRCLRGLEERTNQLEAELLAAPSTDLADRTRAMIERRDMVHAILLRIQHKLYALDELNAELRRRIDEEARNVA